MFKIPATAAMIAAGLIATGAVQAEVRPPLAKISMTKAKAIALKAAPGKLISSEYENEGGGWRYSFDIQQKGNIQEIGINAMTGKIIENKSEGKVDHD
ncbi:MAG: PepSY domain-containing protein [Sphingomicrobium sp.]